MTITLRASKSTALTHDQLDGNFTDLDGRTTTLEGAYVKTVNGVSPTSNAVTITTANITENTNLYYTDARARASISVTDAGGDGSLAYNSSTGVITYTGPSAAEVRAHLSAGAGITLSSGAISIGNDQVKDTMIDFGTGSNQVSTADLPEQTNLYYTNARADARIAAADLDDLSNVDYTGTPTTNHVLTWDGDSWVSAAPPGLGGGEANDGNNLGASGSSVFSSKVGADLQFRKIIGTAPIVATQNTNDITLTFAPSADIDANTQKIINVVDPTGAQHAATKAYVDALDLTLGLAATTGSASTVATSQTLSILGTANEIETAVSGQTVTVGLPSATSITTSLTVPTAIIDEVTISGNNVTTNTSNANLVLLANGTGVVEVDSDIDMNSNKLVNVTDPASAQDAATKAYADLKLALTGGTMSGAIAMGTAKITGMGDPTSAQDAATKAYVDGEVSSLNSDKIEEGDTSVETIDAGTGSVVITVDNSTHSTFAAAGITLAQGAFVGDVTGDVTGNVTGNVSGSSGSTTGNAATATALETARNIGGVSFDGSANINLPGVNTSGNQDTSGNAATATTLETARNIGGVSFDGSAAINLPGVNTSGNQDTSGTAAVATTITVADEGTDTTCFPTFVTAATGNLGAKTDSVLTYNSSNGTLGATTFSGEATSAQYADLAEIYASDAEYPPGTVVKVGGIAEITQADPDAQYLAGVISTAPAYLMNSAADGEAVALVGRVPVRVVGSINKGEAVFATHNGKASSNGQGPIVGIALETNSDLGEKSVECLLKV
jgi:hypothetical protein